MLYFVSQAELVQIAIKRRVCSLSVNRTRVDDAASQFTFFGITELNRQRQSQNNLFIKHF